MMWKDVKLFKRSETGKDELSNPVFSLIEVATKKGQITPWTIDEISLEGREVTKNEQKLLLRVPYSLFPKDISVVEIDGVHQEIKLKKALGNRFTLLRIKVYKNG